MAQHSDTKKAATAVLAWWSLRRAAATTKRAKEDENYNPANPNNIKRNDGDHHRYEYSGRRIGLDAHCRRGVFPSVLLCAQADAVVCAGGRFCRMALSLFNHLSAALGHDVGAVQKSAIDGY
jgi:hypothetical protein